MEIQERKSVVALMRGAWQHSDGSLAYPKSVLVSTGTAACFAPLLGFLGRVQHDWWLVTMAALLVVLLSAGQTALEVELRGEVAGVARDEILGGYKLIPLTGLCLGLLSTSLIASFI